MKLGALVNTDRHADNLIGLVDAALSRGHTVSVFFTDEGVRLLLNKSVTDLCNRSGIVMSYCDYSKKNLQVSADGCGRKIACRSQYDNAAMQHEADRVIVL